MKAGVVCGLASAVVAVLGSASAPRAETLGLYGTPGLIDMPTAGVLEDGFVALSYNQFSSTARNTLTFQIAPRLSGTFRYAIIDDLDVVEVTRYDRSFDASYLVMRETDTTPAVAIGLRDLGGTGVYSSEYVVATKTFGALSGTIGLGWGRLASRNPVTNPLSTLSDRFETRPTALGGVTGKFDAESWFRGDVGVFGGLRYAISDQTSVVVEYSSDTYAQETLLGGQQRPKSPINLGVSHTLASGVTVSGYAMYGTDLGVMVSYQLDPSQPALNGGRDPVAPPLAPRDTVAARSWNIAADPREVEQAVAAGLANQGLALSGYDIAGDTAAITVQNRRWPTQIQAAGRAARVLANTLPVNIETFTIFFERNGVALSSVTLHRADLYDLEFALEGDWNIRARSTVQDGFEGAPQTQTSDPPPAFEFALGPYATLALFDPDSPLRYDLGVQAIASFEPAQGVILSGMLRYPLASTIGDASRVSNSVLPRVRSDGFVYARQSDLEINHLTLEYFYRPAPDVFGRVTAGYLESMYGGVSAELLWSPLNSNLALGADINHVVQRDFDMLWGFQDYNITTGHVSGYYDFGNGYVGQLDVGRYLAGDVGGTVTFARQFDSGFRIGAFATVTDVSAEDFGEGSFDKGIFFDAPLTFFTGQASRDRLQRVIRPVARDGGARVQVRNRLYDMTNDARRDTGNWGTFFQ